MHTVEPRNLMTQPSETRSGKQNFYWSLCFFRTPRLKSGNYAQDARKRIVAFVCTFFCPVANKVLQCLNHTNLFSWALVPLCFLDMIIQLLLLDPVELHRMSDYAFA